MTKAPPNVRLIQCNSLAEIERYGLREFASEFGHEPIGLPIWLCFHDDDLLAYCEIRMTPLIYPAVHPRISPRAFMEGGRVLSAKWREHFPGGFVVYGSETVKVKHMEKFGFRLSPMLFFQSEEEICQNGS